MNSNNDGDGIPNTKEKKNTSRRAKKAAAVAGIAGVAGIAAAASRSKKESRATPGLPKQFNKSSTNQVNSPGSILGLPVPEEIKSNIQNLANPFV